MFIAMSDSPLASVNSIFLTRACRVVSKTLMPPEPETKTLPLEGSMRTSRGWLTSPSALLQIILLVAGSKTDTLLTRVWVTHTYPVASS